MKITRYQNPYNPMQRWLGNDWGGLLGNFFDTDQAFPRSEFAPAVDIVENEQAYILKAELPGLKKEDINVELKENTLTISGERKFEKDEKRENYHRVERAYGSFTRSFMLPNNIAAENVEAKFVDGVLNITLTKRAESRAQGIKIQ